MFNEKVTLGLFSSMFALAFLLPSDMKDEHLDGVTTWIAKWLPNIKLLAAKSAEPPATEVYLLIGLVTAVLAFIYFTWARPGDLAAYPLRSHRQKWVAVGVATALGFGLSTFYWYPSASDYKVGLLSGRWGAFLYLALSSRLGMAILLNLFFCVAPYLLLSLTWIVLKRPVRSSSGITRTN